MYEKIEIIPKSNGLFTVMIWDANLGVTPFVDKTKEGVIDLIDKSLRSNKHSEAIGDPNPRFWNWKNTNDGARWGTPREIPGLCMACGKQTTNLHTHQCEKMQPTQNTVPCGTCGKPMEDRGAENQWCKECVDSVAQNTDIAKNAENYVKYGLGQQGVPIADEPTKT